MTELQLSITRDATPYVYTDDDMGEGTVVASRGTTGDEIERDSIELALDREDVAGLESLVEWPAERLRAEVRDTIRDEALVNGTLHRTGVTDQDAAPDGLRRWTVSVIDTALDDLQEALDAVNLRDSAVLDYVRAQGGQVVIPTALYQESTVTAEDVSWWHVGLLLEGALRAAGAPLAVVPTLFPLSWQYEDSGVQTLDWGDIVYVCAITDSERGAPTSTVPDVSGSDWLNTVRQLVAPLVDASYAAYPSATIEAALRVVRWSDVDPEVLPALDTLEQDLDGYDLACDPAQVPGYVVQYASGEEPLWYDGATRMPLIAQLGTTRRRASRPETTVELLHPQMLLVSTANDAAGTVSTARPLLDVEAEQPYIAALPGDEGPGTTPVRMLHYMEPTYATGTTGPTRTNPTWARELYAAHVLRAHDRLVAQIEVDRDALEEAGIALPVLADPEQGYALAGVSWMVSDIQEGADDGKLELTLERPASGYDATALEALTGPPQLTVTGLELLDYDLEFNSVGSRFEAFATVEPGAGLDTPDRYEVEYDVDIVPIWDDSGPAGTPGLAALGLEAGDTVWFRARSIYETEGVTSDWVEDSVTV